MLKNISDRPVTLMWNGKAVTLAPGKTTSYGDPFVEARMVDKHKQLALVSTSKPVATPEPVVAPVPAAVPAPVVVTTKEAEPLKRARGRPRR